MAVCKKRCEMKKIRVPYRVFHKYSGCMNVVLFCIGNLPAAGFCLPGQLTAGVVFLERDAGRKLPAVLAWLNS